jgi:hypothetical protein
MGLICQYKCADIIFDVYDIERISISTTNNLFYMTPSRIVKVEKYLIENNIPKIMTAEQMNFLIENDYIGIY